MSKQPPTHPLVSEAERLLESLRAPDGRGIYASQGPWFAQSVFGRDSIMTARMVLHRNQRMAREIILECVRLQGQHVNRASGEEPGRIHHEYRNLEDWRPGRPGKRSAQLLALIWNRRSDRMLTYFSSDATPLFILLVAEYCRRYGPGVLATEVKLIDGGRTTVAAAAVAAGDWLLSRDHDGILAIQRRGLFSPVHQSWRDSPTAYLHYNGRLPHLDRPISYAYVQALAADGLLELAKLADHLPSPRSERWQEQAASWRQNLLERFWLPDQRYFASLLDRSRGDWSPLATKTSDMGWLLASGLFDDLSAQERERYVTPVVRLLCSSEFMTDVGVRCRSMSNSDLVGLVDYHGSFTSWPLDTYQTIQGLRRQGYGRLAREFELRLRDGLAQTGQLNEYWIVGADGGALYRPPVTGSKRNAGSLPVQSPPEPGFAWTAATVINLFTQPHAASHSKDTALESELLSRLPYRRLRGGTPDSRHYHAHQPRLDSKRGLLKLGAHIGWRFVTRRF